MKNKELEDKVRKFELMQLPGQPAMMHMGTSYLINDLCREIKELEEKLDTLQHYVSDAFKEE
jgi:hypothetical protein